MRPAQTRCTCVHAADPWSRAVRCVLILLVLIIAITPITQAIWQNDSFLNGHDTETTLAFGLTLVSLAFLRMQRSRAAIAETLLRMRHCLSALLDPLLLLHSQPNRAPAILLRPTRSQPAAQSGFALPLLI